MDSIFEYRNCPVCGQNDFEVLFESNMQDCDFREAVETVYMLWGERYGRHVKCKNCHLIYVNPIEKGNKINESYSQRKSVDATIIKESRLRTAESQVELVKKYKDGVQLLDIGCGEGFFLFNASRAGYTTRGIEISQDAAAYARREFGLDVEAKPFEELRFAENHFDVVTLWQVLEHVPYPFMILEEVYRILKPGGLLAMSTPDIGGILAKIFRRRWWNIRRLHINQFTVKTLTYMLDRAGFKKVFSTSYKEYISLSMLVIPLLRHLKVYGRAKALFRPSSTSGKIMNKLTLVYPSRLDNCTVIGFK
jgi:2-polyprenyl-3-methyl-5-hydroxy-6-metoxy-1,4-benzoquinol methylase